MQPTFVGPWLDQPSEMLGSLKPIEAVERGQIDLVWQVVEGIAVGGAALRLDKRIFDSHTLRFIALAPEKVKAR